MRSVLALTVFLFVFYPSFLLAATAVSTSLSNTSIKYDANNTLQEDAVVTGVRLGLNVDFIHAFEFALDSTNISNDSGSSLKQYDYTGVYTYFTTTWKAKAGLHYIESEHDASNKGATLITGFNTFTPYTGNYGVDFYYTSFPQYGDLSIAGKINGYTEESQLTILQITPRGGINFADEMLYAEFEANSIQPSSNPEIKESSYSSVKGSLHLFYKDWTLSSYLWVGSEVFAVKNGGFSMFNSTDKHIRGSGGSVNYAPSPTFNLGLSLDEDVTENSSGGDDLVNQLYTLSLGYNF